MHSILTLANDSTVFTTQYSIWNVSYQLLLTECYYTRGLALKVSLAQRFYVGYLLLFYARAERLCSTVAGLWVISMLHPILNFYIHRYGHQPIIVAKDGPLHTWGKQDNEANPVTYRSNIIAAIYLLLVVM